jgi:hypothetical protein
MFDEASLLDLYHKKQNTVKSISHPKSASLFYTTSDKKGYNEIRKYVYSVKCLPTTMVITTTTHSCYTSNY